MKRPTRSDFAAVVIAAMSLALFFVFIFIVAVIRVWFDSLPKLTRENLVYALCVFGMPIMFGIAYLVDKNDKGKFRDSLLPLK